MSGHKVGSICTLILPTGASFEPLFLSWPTPVAPKDANILNKHWYLALQPFKFKVVYIPGVLMVVLDYLSYQEWTESGSGAVWQWGVCEGSR